MINFISKGDIFSLKDVSSFAHGCNCAGAMGKGIALQFRQKFPRMYYEYKLLCKKGIFVPGDVFDFDYGNGHIYNLATQLTWRTKAKIEFIQTSMLKMFELATSEQVSKIAMPTIGAGLGGLIWTDVKNVICDISNIYPNISLYVVEEYSPFIK
ncbi:MAG: macro domain-containing protein [Muribaculaceae bacterium]|nr:macro domain-containing protein [Muribaculaceae bacterium]